MILALLAAHQPNAAECHTHARIALDAARLGGSHGIEVHALQALGVNALANNNPEGAIGPLEEAGALSERLNLREFSYWSWPLDLIDAYVRTGRPVEAEHPLELLAWHAQRTRRPTTIAAYHCARGLLAGPGKFEEEFEQALAAHQRATRPLELGRVHLYHGERLRRAKKRSVSRDHLRSALQIFHAIGAGSWAKRAITELEATGIALAETPNPARNLLTPQELQVALALTQGATTKAAATQLFLSQKTVEYHLTRIYRKLEITTRQELANELLGVSR
jgi:DNA-binding CsgD family transcriptional regulator